MVRKLKIIVRDALDIIDFVEHYRRIIILSLACLSKVALCDKGKTECIQEKVARLSLISSFARLSPPPVITSPLLATTSSIMRRF